MDKFDNLYKKACEARKLSYSPYSGFSVGAALLCSDGMVYTGCNIENSAFSPSCCAERVAFYKAVSEGKNNFTAIAVAGGKGGELERCTPCGVCRQVMSEFCEDDFKIITKGEHGTEPINLENLLPQSFKLK